MVDTKALYTGLVALVVVQRLAELRLAERNRVALLEQGAVEVGQSHYSWMVAMHTAFLASCVTEVWLLERPFIPALAASMLILLIAASGARYWAISTLGGRWTTRILVLPGASPVTGGPYRFVRHPNYLAVAAEIAALPLAHTAWITALTFSTANSVLLLLVRIPAEEAALGIHGAPSD